jgi:hypothetical protein
VVGSKTQFSGHLEGQGAGGDAVSARTVRFARALPVRVGVGGDQKGREGGVPVDWFAIATGHTHAYLFLTDGDARCCMGASKQPRYAQGARSIFSGRVTYYGVIEPVKSQACPSPSLLCLLIRT